VSTFSKSMYIYELLYLRIRSW